MNYTGTAFNKSAKNMPFFNTEGLGNDLAGGLLGPIMGLALQGHNDRRQLQQQEELQRLQIAGQKEMMDYGMMKQFDMWLKTNYSEQVNQLKKAGLNPALLYGKGGPGGVTASASGSVQGGGAPAGGREIMDILNMGLQKKMIEAQTKVAEAQAKNIDADTANKPLQGQNIMADTELKVLEQIITKYTGMEAKDVYERIMSPNRSVQSETYQKEMAARQGVAGTIYELWVDGQLYGKSISEIEQIALKNAKTRAETRNIEKQLDILEENLKGAKLDNVIKELESKLQTETGIDKNSPAWMKILGRLFVGLLNK